MCKEYIRIYEAIHTNIDKEKAFMNFHPGHPTQIVNEKEAAVLIKEGYSEFRISYGDLD